MTYSFQNNVFKESIKKLFIVDDEGKLKISFNGKISIFTSKKLKVKDCIGPCASIDFSSTQEYTKLKGNWII